MAPECRDWYLSSTHSLPRNVMVFEEIICPYLSIMGLSSAGALRRNS